MGKYSAPAPDILTIVRNGLRLIWKSVGVDAAVLVGVGITELLSNGAEVTSGIFWTAVGSLVLRSAITAVAAHWARLKLTKNDK